MSPEVWRKSENIFSHLYLPRTNVVYTFWYWFSKDNQVWTSIPIRDRHPWKCDWGISQYLVQYQDSPWPLGLHWQGHTWTYMTKKMWKCDRGIRRTVSVYITCMICPRSLDHLSQVLYDSGSLIRRIVSACITCMIPPISLGHWLRVNMKMSVSMKVTYIISHYPKDYLEYFEQIKYFLPIS